MEQNERPLAGVKVVEFSHMVMGPSIGLILADLGADVIKVEPVGGDQTRRLLGSGAGYFPMYNRNKRSICLDLKQADGLTVARRLLAGADVLIENFRPGTLARLGLDHASLAAENPGLIYCSAKGFLSGPYESRTALDEVAQMMGGLAYMTGPPGRPLRAGSSVIDVTGGMFGVIGILAALWRRQASGRGGDVTCSLFETTAFLVGQHMAQKAVTGTAPNPMPARVSAWAIYDVFDTADAEQVFVGVVSDTQWKAFAGAFDLGEIGADESLATNNARVKARERILPVVRAVFAGLAKPELLARLEALGLPFAPIARPVDLFDDPHLVEGGGLVPVTIPGGEETWLPALPVEMDGKRLRPERDVPLPGADGRDILADIGLSQPEIERLVAQGAVGLPTMPASAEC